MRNTKKKTTKSKTYKRPNQLSETELRRKYNSWMNHFTYGATQIT